MSLLRDVLIVLVPGALGAVSRFRLDRRLTRSRAGLPRGTLVVNTSGCLALGLLTGIGLDGTAALVAGTGFLGAYTTFSTWLYETHRLAEDGLSGPAARNVGVGFAAGLLAAALGWALGSVA